MEPGASEEQPKEREMFGDVPVPRRAKITKQDLKEHGFTARCEGCRAALANKPARPHSQECRDRMENLMKDNPRVQVAKRRQDEFFEKVVEEQDKKDKERARDEGEMRAKKARGEMWNQQNNLDRQAD